MLPRGGGRRSGGRNAGRSGNDDRDQLDSSKHISGNAETGLFTSGGRSRIVGSSGGSGGSGGPVRDSSRRTNRHIGGPRGSTSGLPPRPTRGGLREDQDGDLSMGGEKKTFSPYQRPGRSTRSSTGTKSNGHEDAIVVFVRTNEGVSLAADSDLFEFISRKVQPTKINISNKNTNEMTGFVSFTVDNLTQAKAVKALSGIRFKRMKLLIKTTADDTILNSSGGASRTGTTVSSSNTIETIRTFLRSRYNGGFLNLENMSKDEILRTARIIPPGRSKSRSDVGAVMMKAAAEMFPDVTTISLASNGLTSLEPVAAISKFFPNLQNLSLKDNSISNYKELEYLSTKKLPNLRELILMGNPIRERDIEKNKDDIAYRSEVTKIFTSISILDQLPVAPKISFGLGNLVKDVGVTSAPPLPAPIKGNFFDNPETQSMVLEFLTRYLDMFDTNRSMLEHAYDSNATFSYSVMIQPSPLQKSKGKPTENWSAYIPQSRNLLRIRDLGQRTTRLYFGSQDIIQQGLMKLPDTKHDLADASKFCIDAWQTGGLLPAVCIYIMIHGELQEVRRNREVILKSFDRSFIIAPAPPNSSAAMHGWKCVIVSDQLVFRGYNGSLAWKPDEEINVTPGMAAAVAGASAFNNPSLAPVPGAPVAPQVPMKGTTPEQHAKAQELQKLTGLNYPYALQCLMASGWDVAKGVALTNENRANIPPDAWQQPSFR